MQQTSLHVSMQARASAASPQGPCPDGTLTRARRLQCQRWVLGLSALVLAVGAQAIEWGQLGKVRESIGTAQEAVSASKEALSTAKEVLSTSGQAVDDARQRLGPGGLAPKAPNGSVVAARDQGGTSRLVAVLGEPLAAGLRNGQVAVSLRDQGLYLVQRQSTFSAPAQSQWFAAPQGGSAAVALNLMAEPAGSLFDFSSGRARLAQRGVKIFTLSVHARLPRRSDRRALDAIEQHAMLHASSVQLEWPRQATEILEPTGGQLLVWASDNGVRFPSGFGADGRLFTPDDPMTSLSREYTVVTLDKRGFSFDRSREVAVAFHPVLPQAELDLSRLGYVDAFRAFTSLMGERYPYSNARPIDWTQLQADMRERIQSAAQRQDAQAYVRVFREIGQRLHDGQFRIHTDAPGARQVDTSLLDFGLSSQSQRRGDASVPMPRAWLLDDGRGMVSDVAHPSPAAKAGLQAGAEIIDIAGEPLRHYLERKAALSHCGADSACALDALALGAVGEDSVSVKVKQSGVEQVLQLRRTLSEPVPQVMAAAGQGQAAFLLRSVGGKMYGYIVLNSFEDDQSSLELWQRTLASVNRAGLPGLILDLRGNRGDALDLAAHFLASFFSEEKPLLAPADTQRQFDPVSKVWRTRGGLGLPPKLPLFASGEAYYGGKLILLLGRDCGGACELFGAWLQRAERAQIVAADPTAGGAVGFAMRVSLPGGVVARVPIVAEIGQHGRSYVDGHGVKPDWRVRVDRDFVQEVMQGGDPILDAAVRRLDQVGLPRL